MRKDKRDFDDVAYWISDSTYVDVDGYIVCPFATGAGAYPIGIDLEPGIPGGESHMDKYEAAMRKIAEDERRERKGSVESASKDEPEEKSK